MWQGAGSKGHEGGSRRLRRQELSYTAVLLSLLLLGRAIWFRGLHSRVNYVPNTFQPSRDPILAGDGILPAPAPAREC